jgi:hypothetical protein
MFEHIYRMKDNRLIKSVQLGRAASVRRRGKQRRRCVDVIKDWTGLDIQTAVHMAQERIKTKYMDKKEHQSLLSSTVLRTMRYKEEEEEHRPSGRPVIQLFSNP